MNETLSSSSIQEVARADKMLRRHVLEWVVMAAFGVFVYLLSSHYDVLEHFMEFSREHEVWELDELLVVSFSLVFVLVFFLFKRSRQLAASEQELRLNNEKLATALSEVKELRGVVPMCAACKKIRDDKGYWQHVENYISARTDAQFSHGVCPECEKELYTRLDKGT